jgi:serine/threonine protein kinase
MHQGLNNLSHCPTIEQLRDVITGVSGSPQWDAIEAHLASCSQCEATLDAITEQSDTFVRELCRRPSTADDEPGYQELYRKLISSSYLAQRATSPALEFELPHQLGNYELERPLGHGANGSVFAARHVRLERPVVIKLLHPDLDFDSRSVERFMQEVRAVGCLDHPNIVRATDAGETDGQHYLVMEYVPGLDVSSLLATCGALAMADACEIVRQAAMGLAYLHHNGFVHRDVKPSNLLLTADARVKLLDLGLVQSVRGGAGSDNEPGRLPHGTADYMSPEQWLTFDEVDGRSDLYSLGCTLCKLLTGAPPFRPIPDGFETKSEAHRDAPIPNLQLARPEIPDQLQAIFNRLLDKDLSRRIGSADELANRMESLTVGADLSSLAERAGLEPQPPANLLRTHAIRPRRFTRRHAMAITVAALAGVVFGWPTLRYKMALRAATASLQTDVWRELSLADPAELLPRVAPAINVWEQTAESEYAIHAASRTLLNFGRPISNAYRFAVDLTLPVGHGNAGVFFQLIEDEERDALRFQAIELVRDAGGEAQPQHRLRWTVVRVNYVEGHAVISGDTLAESVVPVSTEPGVHSLEVRARPNDAPLVTWSHEPIEWRLSFEGRSAVRVQKLGCLGIMAGEEHREDDHDPSPISQRTTTTFMKPRLSYADSTIALR